MRILLLLTVFLLHGCDLFGSRFGDGYQFGDITLTLIDLQVAYCSEENALARESIVSEMRINDPNYTPVCE